MFDSLNSIKVPSGYSSNIQGIINVKEKKIQNLKSHDCHVLLTQLLSVILSVLPKNVRLAVVKLCAFMNEISQKAINPNNLIKLQKDIVEYVPFQEVHGSIEEGRWKDHLEADKTSTMSFCSFIRFFGLIAFCEISFMNAQSFTTANLTFSVNTPQYNRK